MFPREVNLFISFLSSHEALDLKHVAQLAGEQNGKVIKLPSNLLLQESYFYQAHNEIEKIFNLWLLSFVALAMHIYFISLNVRASTYTGRSK